ncbi:MAG: hypothetical protein WDA60_01230 [Acidimicrobiia bacterium]
MPHRRFTDVPPGTGPLRPRLVLRHARGMLRARTGRIAGAAFVFFVPPAALFFGAEFVRDARADADGTNRWILLAAVIAVASLFRLLGEVFFAGFLDLAIGDDYFRGERRNLREVLQDLPWRPLVVVDVVVNVGAAIGLALFVVPGLVVYVLLGLVGPVVVQERRGAWDAMRRTARISRPHWFLVLALVVIPLGVEHALAELVRELVHDDGLLIVISAEWLIAVTMLALVGVVEVALATELMARSPE